MQPGGTRNLQLQHALLDGVSGNITPHSDWTSLSQAVHTVLQGVATQCIAVGVNVAANEEIQIGAKSSRQAGMQAGREAGREVLHTGKNQGGKHTVHCSILCMSPHTMAWLSTAGFQAGSSMCTWLAAVRLRPTPPALRLARKTRGLAGSGSDVAGKVGCGVGGFSRRSIRGQKSRDPGRGVWGRQPRFKNLGVPQAACREQKRHSSHQGCLNMMPLFNLSDVIILHQLD